ncbi:MAG: succinate dehydrogenase iron-sulfur subunit, partial [Candidatus Sumerlaeia bacterium]|nr:succinate dehydrogenase iron-sulfur subunit [Candidatus Sumerlaeia bacterium]
MPDTSPSHRTIEVYIRRYNPERDTQPRWQRFTLPVARGMTVLDGLHRIREEQDPTVVFRYSCRMSVCGSCAMLINGRPALACNTQIADVAPERLTLAPLPNFDIIKDLVPDLAPMFQKHSALQPYIQRPDTQEVEKPTGEFYQSPKDLERYLQFAYCIKCGSCMSGCPTLATDPQYPGPMPLAQAYRYSADSRDSGFDARKIQAGASHGVFRCHYAGECSNVCPKGVDPARALQLLKRELVMDYLRLRRRRCPAQVLGPPSEARRNPDIPAPPPYT